MTTQNTQYRLGLVLAAAAALAWSSAGIFTRLISADLMTMLFWRGLFSGTAVWLVFFLLEGRNALGSLRHFGWPSAAVAFLSAMGMITGIGSFRFTSVADSMVIYATVPFMTAGIAWLAIGERTSRGTIVASAIAMAGVIIMLAGSEWGGSLIGKGLAVLMTLSMACFSVILRRNREVPMLPAMASSAWLCSFFCFWFAAPLSISSHDFMLVAMFGVIQNALGLVFYTFGSQRIPAAEATLLAALEVPFTPLWVWVFLGEAPTTYTLIGGLIVLAALFGHIINEARKGSNSTEDEFAPVP